ncbi:MAG TPA: hypothetical protein H9827_03315 [Candidatus Luteimonas excrementigallinarum]|nr:hypothetical protein [Candidatus Luteimonas excrementigallinarum]
MNTHFHTPRPAHASRPVVLPPARPEARTRDLGIGYGNSSGYFHNRRYAGGAAAPRFRLI